MALDQLQLSRSRRELPSVNELFTHIRRALTVPYEITHEPPLTGMLNPTNKAEERIFVQPIDATAPLSIVQEDIMPPHLPKHY
jgi:hypothetical protein